MKKQTHTILVDTGLRCADVTVSCTEPGRHYRIGENLVVYRNLTTANRYTAPSLLVAEYAVSPDTIEQHFAEHAVARALLRYIDARTGKPIKVNEDDLIGQKLALILSPVFNMHAPRFADPPISP